MNDIPELIVRNDVQIAVDSSSSVMSEALKALQRYPYSPAEITIGVTINNQTVGHRCLMAPSVVENTVELTLYPVSITNVSYWVCAATHTPDSDSWQVGCVYQFESTNKEGDVPWRQVDGMTRLRKLGVNV